MDYRVFVLFLCVLAYGSCEMNPTIKFYVTFSNNTYGCKPERDEYTLKQGSVHIMIFHPSFIDKMMCKRKDEDIPLQLLANRNISKVDIQPEFGGVWNCTILSNIYIETFKRHYCETDQNGKKVSYAAVDCIMNVHVRRSESLQEVHINSALQSGQELSLLPLSETKYDKELVHYYEKGDVLDVYCASLSNKVYHLEMGYSYLEALEDQLNTPRNHEPVRLKVKLGTEHNNTFAICKSYVSNDYFSIGIKFVTPVPWPVQIKVNGLSLNTYKIGINNIISYNYNYIENELINISCAVNKVPGHKLSAEWIYQKPEKVESITKDHEYTGKLVAKFNGYTPILACFLNINGDLRNTARLEFREENKKLPIVETHVEINPLPYYQLYQGNKEMWVIYEEGDEFNMTCSKQRSLVEISAVSKDRKSDNSSIQSGTNLITMTIHPNNYSEATCSIINSKPEEKVIVRFIHDVEHVPSTTESSGLTGNDDEDLNRSKGHGILWQLGVASTVATLVLIGSGVFIYQMQKRKKVPDNQNYDNLHHGDDTPIPPVPQQWDNIYAEPGDHIPEAAYSQPYHPKASMYATPLPKSQRPHPKINQDPMYEDTIYSEVQTLGIKDKLDRLYAKIAPKEQRREIANEQYVNATPKYSQAKNLRGQETGNNNYYGNVIDVTYHNINSTAEYVEPTYCEPGTSKNK